MKRLDAIPAHAAVPPAQALLTVTHTTLPGGEALRVAAAQPEAGAVLTQEDGRTVIAAHGPLWQTGSGAEMAALRESVLACLTLACAQELETADLIAVPTGVYDSRLFQAATVLLQAVRDFQALHALPRCVRLLCADEREVPVYKQAYNFWFADTKAARLDHEGWD